MLLRMVQQLEELSTRYDELIAKSETLTSASQYAYRCMVLIEADIVLGRKILIKDDINRIIDINRIKKLPTYEKPKTNIPSVTTSILKDDMGSELPNK